MKNIFAEIEAACAYEWSELPNQPVEAAVLALQSAALALDGLPDTLFHTMLQIVRASRRMEAWKHFIDPDVDLPFVDGRKWFKGLFPRSQSYALKAWDREETLKAVPMESLKGTTQAVIDVLADDRLSSNLRTNPDVLKAAQNLSKDGFISYLNQTHQQHIEPVRVMPKVDAAQFDLAVAMVMAVDDLTRSEALLKIASMVIAEYAVAYEHLERTA
jgi:hypothetical protein